MNQFIVENSDAHLIVHPLPNARIEITHETIERVLSFLVAHPDRAACISEKINEAIKDIITIEEYAVKIGLYWQERNGTS